MGRRTERYRSYQAQAAAGAATRAAQQRRDFAEESLRYQESVLGTPGQVRGTLGGPSAELAPYLGRYQLDRNLATSLSTGHKRAGHIYGTLAGNVQAANELLDQAEQAARGGDFELAADLRQQAEQRTQAGNFYPLMDQTQAMQAITWRPDVMGESQARLSSPMAQTLGESVRQAREFMLNPQGETAQRFRRSLTETGERAIAAESRGAQRAQRQLGLATGAGRRALAERAVAARTSEQFATQRAQLHSQADQFFETWKRDYAQDTLGFAQAWLQGQAGIREQYQSAMDTLYTTQAEIFSRGADRSLQFGQQSEMVAQMARNRTTQLVSSAAQLALGAAIGGVPGMIVGGLKNVWAGLTEGDLYSLPGPARTFDETGAPMRIDMG